MSDNFSTRAELEVRLAGLRELVNDLENVKDGIADVDAVQKKWTDQGKATERQIGKIDRELKKVASSAKDATKNAGPGSGASQEWQDLAAAVEKAEVAYKELALSAAAAGNAKPNMAAFMASDKGVSSSDLAKYRQGRSSNLLGDDSAQLASENRVADAAARNWIAAEERKQRDAQRVADVAARNYISKAEKRAADEKRIADIAARNWIAAEELKQRETSGRNYNNFATQMDDTGFYGRVGLKASDTTFAKEALGEVAKTEAALPRLRYALYDVATTAGIASAAITGVGIASVAAFASMESSFTNVERTLDNVSGAKVQELRSELVALTREIPLTFANVSEIATLGNQLGIASSDIAQFTETTAKFSAVTGLTAEASAQAFGSLGELLNVQARDYEALGSSIALVGRRSVATESEIVSMTTRLAASATTAGFTAQQVIALSGAFASLRIAPERAQGVMEIYFKTLNTAISEGGPRLEAFARTAGVTTAEVENLVRTDPVAFFERLAVGLGQLDNIAQTGALADLGLQGIRAGEVFGRVSANVEVFNAALKDANQGWSEGTELGAQYAKVVDDLASRWQIFLNSVQAAGAAVGATLAPALGVVLNLLTTMAQGLTAFNDLTGGWVVGPIAFIASLVAGFLGLISVSALFLASAAAMKTAMAELTIGGATAGFSLRGLAGAATQVGTAMGFSAGMIRTFKIALASTGIGLLVVGLGTLAAGLIDAATASGELSAELQPVADSLARAIEADTAVFHETGEAIKVTTRELKNNAPAADAAATAAQNYAGIQSDTASGVDAATRKIEEQTVALGANAEALFRKQLADDSGFSQLANDAELRAAAEQAGFTIDQLISEALSKSGGATAYVQQLRDQANQLMLEWQQATASGGATAATDGMYAYASSLQAVADKLSPVSGDLDSVRSSALAAGEASEYAGIAADGAADGFANAGDAASGAASNIWDAASAALDIENRLFSLGSTLGENAGMWDVYSEAGRANLGSLYAWMDAIATQSGGDTSAIASNFAAMYNALIEGGVATANQLAFLKAQVEALAGTSFSNVKPAQKDFSNLFNGIQTGAAKAAKAIGGGGGGGGGSVKEAVRTLLDYARDLEGVFKRAFDIRFGNQQGLDGITAGWRGIADASAKAREEIEKYQNTLAGLTASKAEKEYWLSVAENYGDELRAIKLRAELAELNSDQAKTQKDLSKAQDAANKTLNGNSEAAIDNRKTITDMVSSYQDLLGTYAANGMSQADLQRKAAQLKQEFMQQAAQAGFSSTEIQRYAASFDGMALAINRVPRNITVNANVDPAKQALAEFEAKAQAAGRNASNSIRSGGGAGYSVPPMPPLVIPVRYQMPSYAALMAMQNAIRQQTGDARFRIGLGPGGQGGQVFKSGGYTGGTSVNDIVGAVHGKEYVMSAPAVRTLGVNGMNTLHTMLNRGQFPMMSAGAAAGPGLVDLSAASIRALATQLAGSMQLVLPGAQLAGSVGAHNVVNTRRGAA